MNSGASITGENWDKTWGKRGGGSLRHINRENPNQSPSEDVSHCTLFSMCQSLSNCAVHWEEEKGGDYSAGAASISAVSENVEHQQRASQYQPCVPFDCNNYHHHSLE